MIGSLSGENDGFSAERACFCASDIKCVGAAGNILQCDIRRTAGEGISQPGAVQIQRNMILLTYGGERFQLFSGIQCPVLCGLGNLAHARKYHVLMIRIAIKGFQIFF